MNKTGKLYWACQIAGWGAYSAAALFIATLYTGWRASIVVGFVLFFFYSIALTHLLRAQIRKRDWLLLPAARGVPRIFGAALLVAAVQIALVVSIARLLTGANAFDASAFAGTAGGLAFMTVFWTALYMGVAWNRRYRLAQLKEVQLQLTLRQAELRALQAQVNPHFLFNCLNTIRGMVIEDPARAQQMITNLAALFRRSLQSTGAQMVSLSDEMDAVAEYLDLEATRFEERLRVSLDVDASARDCSVPAMLVQTLVENAIKHGISMLPAGGSVKVRGTRDRQSLVLQVENSGRIREPDPNGTHTGLANARERLRLFYGERATLELTGTGGMVTATVVIPQST